VNDIEGMSFTFLIDEGRNGVKKTGQKRPNDAGSVSIYLEVQGVKHGAKQIVGSSSGERGSGGKRLVRVKKKRKKEEKFT